MGRNEQVEVGCQVMAESANAYRIHDGARTQWVPKSQVKLEYNGRGGVTAVMPEWLAKEKGFI